MKLYKWLTEYGSGRYSGFEWPLPKNGRPGKWVRVKGKLIKCEHGIHACREQDLVHWIGPKLWELEAPGKVYDWDDKVGVRLARLLRPIETWNKRTARLFACDCAERALGYIEEPDPRSIEAIAVSRRFALGDATDEELAAAGRPASAAAWAADAAAWTDDAAWAAAAIALAASAAGWAASAAVWAAASAAARAAAAASAASAAVRAAAADAAAAAAARGAERAWQTDRLMEYLK